MLPNAGCSVKKRYFFLAWGDSSSASWYVKRGTTRSSTAKSLLVTNFNLGNENLKLLCECEQGQCLHSLTYPPRPEGIEVVAV